MGTRITSGAYDTCGFSLIELQIYLTLMVLVVILLVHSVLMYRTLFDRTTVRAQQNVLLLAALQKIDAIFDHASLHVEHGVPLAPVAQVKNRRLEGLTATAVVPLLDDVTGFEQQLDIRNNQVCGIKSTCVYQSNQLVRYRASRKKVFSCSYSL